MIREEWLTQEWTKHDVYEFRKNSKLSNVFLCTTRFNNKTYAENRNACKRLNLKCFYSNPYVLPQHIPQGATVYVLEMNNEENKIMGIGKIQNYLQMDVYRVYENDFYNQMYFAGNERIRCDTLHEEQKQFICALERLCFYGRTHLKRGHRMTCFPIKTLGLCQRNELDILDRISEMFKP